MDNSTSELVAPPHVWETLDPPQAWICAWKPSLVYCRGPPPQQWSLLIGGVCTCVATTISTLHFLKHCRNQAPWSIKICTLKILLIVPLYSLNACLSLFNAVDNLHLPEVLTFVREMYEAVVLVAFLQLVLNWLNGPVTVANAFARDMQSPQHPSCLKVVPTFFKPGLRFIMAILRGLLQFVVVMVAVTFISVSVWGYGALFEHLDSEDVWFQIPEKKEHLEQCLKALQALSCGYAMYILTVFYFELERNETLKHRFELINPELKFLSIKGVIMFTMMQSFACKVAARLGFFSNISWAGSEGSLATATPQPRHSDPSLIGMAVTSLLICVEMLFFSVLHLYAYPSAEFNDSADPAGGGSAGWMQMMSTIWQLTKQADLQNGIIAKLQSNRGLTEDEAEEAFEAFDVNADCTMSVKEFKYTLECAHVSKDNIRALLTKADQDGDGQITMREFKSAFRANTWSLDSSDLEEASCTSDSESTCPTGSQGSQGSSTDFSSESESVSIRGRVLQCLRYSYKAIHNC